MKDLSQKTVTLKGNKLQQLLPRLPTLGFTRNEHGVWMNSNAEANIQQIAWGHDRIDTIKWVCLIVQARNPEQIESDLQLLGLCQADDIVSDQQRQAELERELRLTKE